MVATTATPRHAPPRFLPLPPLQLQHFDDQPVLADLIAFVATLDLRPLQQTYRGFGSDAWPVDRLLLLALFRLHHGQPSPSDWHRQVREHTGLCRVFANRVPARSVWYAFRDRLAGPLQLIHQNWLQQQRPNHPELGQQLAIDGSLIALQASRHNLKTERSLLRRIHLLRLERWLADLEQALRPVAPALRFLLLWLVLSGYARHQHVVIPRYRPAWMARSARGRVQQEQRYLQAIQTLQARVPSGYAQRKRRRHLPPRISPTAPQALLGRDKQHVFRPLVHVQIAVDVSSGLVTVLELGHQLNDVNQLLPLCTASARNTGVTPQRAAVDLGYVQRTQWRGAMEQGLEVFSSVAAAAPPPRVGKKYPAAAFRWRPREREYVCPQGERLRYRRRGSETRASGERVALELYQAEGTACAACAQASRCTTNPSKGRVLKRLAEEELRETCQERSGSALGELLHQARKSGVERVFGDGKEHRGQERISGRSPQAAQGQLGLAWLYLNARSTFTRSLN